MSFRHIAHMGVTALTLFLSMQAAKACPRTENQLICPGDRVVAKNYQTGLSWPGQAIAVNPYHNQVSVRHDDGDLATWNVSDVAVGVGCIQGYCVGDRAVGTNHQIRESWGGRIVGVNPFRQEIAIYQDDGDTVVWAIESVSLGLGCIEGYCVGDQVVATNYNTNMSYEGKIVGVNPFRREVAIYHTDGDLVAWNIENVSNSRYCADYGAEVRSHRRYPMVNEQGYQVQKYKFSLHR